MIVLVVVSPSAPATGQPADEMQTILGVLDDLTAATRFAWVDIYLDSGDVPLAAYQLELTAETGDFTIVGVEGGDSPAFAAPPFYDPAALANDRIILAAYSTDEALPTGPTRVARVHVQITSDADPEYVINLTAAADASGRDIAVTAYAEQGEVQ